MTAPTKRNSHTALQREFIVRRLAAFDQPREIATLFAAMFPDTACNENDVWATDPRITLVAPELHALFLSERARIVADKDSAVYADQNARLIVLSKDVDRYRSNNEAANARVVLRQIAEECGAVGGKGAGKPDKAMPVGEPITEIRVTYVDPKAPEPVVT